jgi:hypothetical protein
MSPAAQGKSTEKIESPTEATLTSPSALTTMATNERTTYLSKKNYEIPVLKDDGSNYTA